MLLSEVDCVPIRGISLFAGNHGYENWMITVCLLCRCCARKSSVSLHEPTWHRRGQTERHSREDRWDNFRRHKKNRNGTWEIPRHSQPRDIQPLVHDIRKRILYLEKLMTNIEQPSEAQALQFQTRMESIKAKEEDMKMALKGLGVKISSYIASKILWLCDSNAIWRSETRGEWAYRANWCLSRIYRWISEDYCRTSQFHRRQNQ